MSHRDMAWSRPRRGREGAILLVILIVAVIIAVIMMSGPMRQVEHKSAQVSSGLNNIERSADVTCQQNRRAIETELTQARILNDGHLPSAEEMRIRFEGRFCPRNGGIVIGQDGTVYCTEHFPPPVEELSSLILLSQPTIETPVPPPPVFTPAQ